MVTAEVDLPSKQRACPVFLAIAAPHLGTAAETSVIMAAAANHPLDLVALFLLHPTEHQQLANLVRNLQRPPSARVLK